MACNVTTSRNERRRFDWTGWTDDAVQTFFYEHFAKNDMEAIEAVSMEMRKRGMSVESVLAWGRKKFYEAWRRGDYNAAGFAEQVIQEQIRLDKEVGVPPPPQGVDPGRQITGDGYEAQYIVMDKRKQFVVPSIHKLMYTVFYTREHPQATAHAQALVDADLHVDKITHNHYALFDRWAAQLKQGKTDKKLLRSAMEILATHNQQRIDELRRSNPVLHQVATELREWYDARREDIKNYKRLMIGLTISPQHLAALSDVVDNGMSIADSARLHGIRQDTLVDSVADYVAIDHWGIDDYITNAMKGSWKLLDGAGHVRVIATTRDQLVERGWEFLRQHPEVTSLEVDTSAPELDYMTPMSKRAYQTMAGKLGRELQNDSEYISAEMAKRAAREALRRVVTIKPSKNYSPFFQKRRNVLEGEADLFDILYSYAHSVEKKINIDPIIQIISKDIDSYPTNVKKALEEQIEDLKGRYYPMDQLVDGLVDAFTGKVNEKFGTRIGGGRPFRASRVADSITQGVALAKLSYRPIAGLINKVSGEQHVWIKVGTKYALRAKKWMNTTEGKAFLDSEESLGELGNTFTGMDSGQKLPWYHGLYLFNKPEAGMRRYGLAANYLVGRDMGMDEAQARYFARRAMHMQLFLYNTAAIPRLLRGPLGRVVGQFKPFLIQEMQFIRQLDRKQFMRYMVTMSIIAGPRGLIVIAKSFPILGLILGFDRLEEWANREWPRLSRGIAGLFGGDISYPASWQLPTQVDEWMGPFFSELYRLYANVFAPALQGSAHTAKHFREWLHNVVLVYKNFSDAIDQVMAPDGWVRDSQGNPKWRPEATWDLFLTILGVTPLAKSQQQVAMQQFNKEMSMNQQNYREELGYYVKDYHKVESLRALGMRLQKYINDGGTLPIPILNAIAEHAAKTGQANEERINNLIMYGLTSRDAVQAAVKKSYMTPQQRKIEEARLLEKMRALGAFDLEYGQ